MGTWGVIDLVGSIPVGVKLTITPISNPHLLVF
jgi:hypothetical protein